MRKQTVWHYPLYLNHPEIVEILISGSDPLVLDNSYLLSLLEAIRKTKKDIIIRLCTRVPVVLPARITPSLITSLSYFKPIWLVTQFNHPNEITEQSREALLRIMTKVIPILNQTVLLKGRNDNTSTLNKLFHLLTTLMVKPYYLFQGDLACGTSLFRVSLVQGMKIYQQIRKTLSGIALPEYTLDLPGGGKISLSPSCLQKKEDRWFLLKDYYGKVYKYPDEGE